MSDDLRAAAKRLVEGEFSENYPKFMATTFGLADGFLLARAYLADNPDDDDEPVTMEWWKSLNNDTRFLCQDTYTLQLKDDLIFVMEAEVGLEDCVTFPIPMSHVRTRGDVRRLCKALGIELKEKS